MQRIQGLSLELAQFVVVPKERLPGVPLSGAVAQIVHDERVDARVGLHGDELGQLHQLAGAALLGNRRLHDLSADLLGIEGRAEVDDATHHDEGDECQGEVHPPVQAREQGRSAVARLLGRADVRRAHGFIVGYLEHRLEARE